MINAETVARIQHHDERLRQPDYGLVCHFYVALFEQQPTLRELFPQDLSKLYVHFDAVLTLVIDNLGRIATVDVTLHELGVNHI